MTARVVADSENGLGIYLESHDLDDVILSGLVEVNQSNGESLRRWKISPARVKLSETPRFDALDARGLKNDIYTLRIRLAGVDATDRNKGPESLWIEEHVRVQDTIPTLLSDDEWLTVSDSLAQR